MTLGKDEVDDNVLGFAEMMTIKLGEMMDQPRHVRMAALANEKQRKIEQEQARLDKQERDRKNFEKLQAMKEEILGVYNETMPKLKAIFDGDADDIDPSEQRRLQRRNELQLLFKEVMALIE